MITQELNNKILPRIPSLDGLRAIAILLVVFGHGLPSFYAWAGIQPNAIVGWFDKGHTGVTIFFVLSGYLITRLIRSELESTSAFNIIKFYVRRALRIFPAFYAFVGVVGVLVAIGVVRHSFLDVFLASVHLFNYRILSISWNPAAANEAFSSSSWYLGHTWTLALEQQYYLLWPLAILVLGLRRSRWLAILVLILSPVLRVATHFLLPGWRGHTGIMLPWAADSLILGSLAGLCAHREKFEKYWSDVDTLVFVVGDFLFLCFLSPLASKTLGGGYNLLLAPSLNSLVVLHAVLWFSRHPSCIAGKLLNSSTAKWFGSLSYSLYLWQQLYLVPAGLLGHWSQGQRTLKAL